MAYADFDFYVDSFYGDVLTDEDTANKWLERASEHIDALTFNRLVTGFPEVEAHAVKVKKAVCAVAEALYHVEQQRIATAAAKDAQGNVRGAVTSISSGRESVSYSQATNTSVYAKAVADGAEMAALIRGIAVQYLSWVTDKHGICLLYAGVM